MFLDYLWGFIYRYFIVPGYDWVDTTTYGLVLGLLVIFALIPVLKRLKIRLDYRFFIGVTPFMVFGATARELVDRGLGLYSLAGSYPSNFWLVSPWIFFTMFFLTFACMLLGILLNSKVKSIGYHLIMVVIGGPLCAYNVFLVLLNMKNPVLFFYVASVFGVFMVFTWFLSKLDVFSYFGREFNLAVVGAHLLDASATFVGVDFLGYGEQHVLPSFLIGYFGTAFVMFPLKLIVVAVVLYVIESELKDDETSRRFLKFVVLVLGFGPALRDIVMMVL
ncbi:MAG: DUF63 family protein [Candidatus Altiarchaeota archaeon]